MELEGSFSGHENPYHKQTNAPYSLITTGQDGVAAAPSHVIQCGVTFNILHPLGQLLNITQSKSPLKLFIDFHAEELLIQPTPNILVRQPMSLNQRGRVTGDGIL